MRLYSETSDHWIRAYITNSQEQTDDALSTIDWDTWRIKSPRSRLQRIPAAPSPAVFSAVNLKHVQGKEGWLLILLSKIYQPKSAADMY